jgi:hypothetical protein
MATNGSRFHVEVTGVKAEDEMSVRFNIFGDTLAQVTADLEQVIAYVTGTVPLLSKPMPAVSARATGAAPAVPSFVPKLPPPPAKTGTCIGCGSNNLEWVTGTRKDNHKPFAAFKCQECGKWQPEAK